MNPGPCAKARVRCTIVLPFGDRRIVGENFCANAQPVCPRAPGEGYEKCRTVCAQLAHAEVVAVLRLPLGETGRGGVAYLEGHTYACDPCKAALEMIGVTDIRIGAPPPVVPDMRCGACGAVMLEGGASAVCSAACGGKSR
jgi:hypothetical protein